jgi:tRNA G10  N-methylase Trm11
MPRDHHHDHGVPISVWPVGQLPSRVQRRGRYLPQATAHPGKMLPALARHAITAFTRPGELVLDPMCGIGTTLIEATHLGRDAIGIEYEQRWADLTAAGLTHATHHGATGTGQVIHGDARTAPAALTTRCAGRVVLLLTSPPYGASVHGQVTAAGTRKVQKWDNSYGRDPANLAHQTPQALLAGFADILRACRPLMAPGGVVAVTARPWRHHGTLIDFPSAVLHAATTAGYQPVQRCVALLAAVRDGDLVTRASFFQLQVARKARAAGRPLHVPAHEDVLILQNPGSPAAAPGRPVPDATAERSR